MTQVSADSFLCEPCFSAGAELDSAVSDADSDSGQEETFWDDEADEGKDEEKLEAEPRVGEEEDEEEEAELVAEATVEVEAAEEETEGEMKVVQYWSNEHALEFLTNMIDQALTADDKVAGTRQVWTEWAQAEKCILPEMRQRIVDIIDAKLKSAGFPSWSEAMSWAMWVWSNA